MPVKYVDEASGELIAETLGTTGAPSSYGIRTIEDLVQTSLIKSAKSNIFFNAREAKL